MRTALNIPDKFFNAYVDAALWSSTDDDGTPLDTNYSVDDFAPETLSAMRADCKSFQAENYEDLALYSSGRYSIDEMGGHDFWLTRNGHGAGFWDRDPGVLPRDAAKRLTDAAHAYGSADLYVGDDGMIYQYGAERGAAVRTRSARRRHAGSQQDLMRAHAASELEEIQQEMLELLDNTKEILRMSGDRDAYEAANSYWIAHIKTALTNEHEYLGGSMLTMEQTINRLRGEDEEYGEREGYDD